MTYPTSNPVNKHDLTRSSDISVSRTSPTMEPSAFIQDAISSVSSMAITSSSDVQKLATIYTYKDAPVHPRPMSASLPIHGFCKLQSLGLIAMSSLKEEPHRKGFITCRIAVKRADQNYPQKLHLKPKDIMNSQNFAALCRQLRIEEKAAFFVCPKTQRGGFLIPMDASVDGCDYALYCWVANLNDMSHLFHEEDEFSCQKHQEINQQHINDFNEADLWKPPASPQHEAIDSSGLKNDFGEETVLWQPSTPPVTESFELYTPSVHVEEGSSSKNMVMPSSTSDMASSEIQLDKFHTDRGAAAADEFYSSLTRSLDTRADSMLYHMRNFNGWVKATQILELDPVTFYSTASHASKKRKRTQHPLRVLDLACGKGGDLGKWVLHKRGIESYVGIDVARGSLLDAAFRARKMKDQLKECVFTCADLGSDVPGRTKSSKHKRMQKLLTWSIKHDNPSENPNFQFVRGGGIAETDKFDVVSIQFAIHYMMSNITRARRFFHTVSQLLEIGGNLIATTIDARVVLEHMMNTGYNFHYDSVKNRDEDVIISVGNNACQLKFHSNVVEKIFHAEGRDDSCLNSDLFGLEYTFTLIEGQDHAVGVGHAVDLPEWLTPLPVLVALGEEAGLVLEYASNFHDFYDERKDPIKNHKAHGALYNMNVLNRSGTISEQEWEISRMYMAIKFRKERESKIVIDDTDSDHDDDQSLEEGKDGGETLDKSPAPGMVDMKDPKVAKLYMTAMSKAKSMYSDEWPELTSKERTMKANEVFVEMMNRRMEE